MKAKIRKDYIDIYTTDQDHPLENIHLIPIMEGLKKEIQKIPLEEREIILDDIPTSEGNYDIGIRIKYTTLEEQKRKWEALKKSSRGKESKPRKYTWDIGTKERKDRTIEKKIQKELE